MKKRVLITTDVNYGASTGSATLNTALDPSDLEVGSIGLSGINPADDTQVLITDGVTSTGLLAAASNAVVDFFIAVGTADGTKRSGNIQATNASTKSAAYVAPVKQVYSIGYKREALTADDVAWWAIKIYVVTAFDSSAPQLRIGNSAHTDVYYYAPTNPGWDTTGWKTPTLLSTTPDRIAGSENITCQYNDSSTNGNVGDAYIYFFYSKH